MIRVAIIGAGLAGLSASLELVHPGARCMRKELSETDSEPNHSAPLPRVKNHYISECVHEIKRKRNPPDAVPLSDSSLQIDVYESSRYLGGRGSSFYHSGSKRWLDHGQHVVMNCCTACLDFLKRTGTIDMWERQTHMNLCVPRTDQSRAESSLYMFRNTPWLPKPFHLSGALLGMNFLTIKERLLLGCILRKIQKRDPAPGNTFWEWLTQLGGTPRIQDFFFRPVILSALSDSLEHVSARMAKKVLSDGFLTRRDAWHLWLPRKSLHEIFHEAAGSFLAEQGIRFHPLTQLTQIEPLENGQGGFLLHGRHYQSECDVCILAVPWRVAGKLAPFFHVSDAFIGRSISAVHFWTDRPLFPDPAMAFFGRFIQWIFRDDHLSTLGFHHQALVSYSDTAHKENIQERVCAEIKALFPEASVKSPLLRNQLNAVFSPSPNLDEGIRPKWFSSIKNLYIAGDWTDTGWPATLESAVRSGTEAARCFFRSLD